MLDLNNELLIDSNKLGTELVEQAARYVYYAQQAVVASAEYAQGKIDLDELYAVIDTDIRAKAGAENKKLTEKVVENAILQDPQYKEAQAHLLTLKTTMDMLKVKSEGFSKRGTMLVQLCSMKNAEKNERR